MLMFSTMLILNVSPPVDPIVEIAVRNCRHVSEDRYEDALKVASILYDVEKRYDVPDSLKGMVLAAACMESGFNPNAQGDRKFSKSGKIPKAIGVLQQWRVYEKAYGTNRRDPKSAAEGWMAHIAKMIPKVRRQCRYKTEEKVWVAAWVTGIRSRKVGGRCREKPKHLKYLRKIRKAYKIIDPATQIPHR